jgi:ribosome-associated heat shock protein Hsp15
MGHEASGGGKVRLDKWLWAARFYKTRSLSAEEIDKGRVKVNGAAVKPARELRIDDRVDLRIGPVVRTVVVRALSGVRGSATVAALLYEETPADTIAQGRPSKRDRRDIEAWRQPAAGWNDRWSASVDDHDGD